MLFVIFFGLVFFFPSPAWAYLDPGTGNMLVYILISLVGVAAYFIKNIFYKSLRILKISKSRPEATGFDDTLVIFSEGKIYWNTFKPIIEALLELKQPVSYLSMDIEDPGLTIENPHLDNRYIGEGSAAFARACQSRAKIMLATTPNIGTPGYPMPLPRHVENLVHVFHGVGDVGSYRKFALDNYQTVLTMGDFMLESIRSLEKKRDLPAKTCIKAGLPYLDDMLKKVKRKSGLSESPVILLAPSWGEKNFIARYGLEPLESLAREAYTLILRPHPYSKIAEPEIMEEAAAKLSIYPNVSFDFDPDASSSFSRADLMISDLSGVRYDFALLYQRPVITISMPLQDDDLYDLSDLDHVWELDTAEELGPVLNPENMAELGEQVKRALGTNPEDLTAFRERYLANYGCAGLFIAKWLINECARLKGLEPSLETEE